MTQSVVSPGAARQDTTGLIPASQDAFGKDPRTMGMNGSASTFGPEYYRAEGYIAFSGRVTHVRDGDTIEVGVQAIRIEGLHAPELGTEIGQQAKRFLPKLVAGKFINCWLSGAETRDRKVKQENSAQRDHMLFFDFADLSLGQPKRVQYAEILKASVARAFQSRSSQRESTLTGPSLRLEQMSKRCERRPMHRVALLQFSQARG